MENRLKLKISKMFNSCRSKNNSDVSDQPFFFPENIHHRQLIDLFSPKPQSLCKPKWQIKDEPKHHLYAPKTSGKTPSFPVDTECRKPQKATKFKKKPHHRKPKIIDDFSSATDNYYHDWRSSDEEDESDGETTLFSFHSFSSESSESFRKNRASRKTQKKSRKTHAGAGGGGDGGRCVCEIEKGLSDTPLENSGKLVKDSFAVVKKSRNPHEDFRVSMLEMIVEQQIFGAEDLEDLLECFISLNSEEHHRVIFEVFVEIWDALFSPPV